MATEVGIFSDIPVFNAGLMSTIDYFDQNIVVKRAAPRIKLKISPFIPPFLPIELVSQDLGGIIQSCTHVKSRSAPGGEFNISFAADDKAFVTSIPEIAFLQALWSVMGASARDIMKPMAYAQLWEGGVHVMSGYLTSFTRDVSSQGGVSKMYNANFVELGNLYTKETLQLQTVYTGFQAFFVNAPDKLIALATKKIAMPVPAAMLLDIQAFIGSTLSYGFHSTPFPFYRMSDGIPLALRLVAAPPPIGAISFNSLVQNLTADVTLFDYGNGGSFWDYLKQMAPEPFIEMWTESGGRTLCVGRVIPTSTSITSVANITETGGSSAIANTAEAAGNAVTATGQAAKFGVPGLNVSVLLPGFNYVVYRTTPYENPLIGLSAWNFLFYPYTMGVIDLLIAGDFIIITDEDVLDKSLGVSEVQQYTLFKATLNASAASSNSEAGQTRPQVADGPFGMYGLMPGGIRTYGARTYTKNIPITSLKWAGIVGQTLEEIQKGITISSFSSLLCYWFRNAAKFNEGTIKVRKIPYARIGMLCLYLPSTRGTVQDDPRDYGMYYIDQVEGNYVRGEADSTTLSVIRGTPIPMSASSLIYMLMDWEFLPVGLNLSEFSV